jgi:hypothetical protein
MCARDALQAVIGPQPPLLPELPAARNVNPAAPAAAEFRTHKPAIDPQRMRGHHGNPHAAECSLPLKPMPYDAGGNCHPDSRTAITASVRLVTLNTLKMAVT